MRKLVNAVIHGAKHLCVWQEQRGAWDIGSAVRLFENVKHLFEYPTKDAKIRRTIQISWLTVYNLYVGHGCKCATELATTSVGETGGGSIGDANVMDATATDI